MKYCLCTLQAEVAQNPVSGAGDEPAIDNKAAQDNLQEAKAMVS